MQFAAQGKRWHIALDPVPVLEREHPVGMDLGLASGAIAGGQHECCLPRIFSLDDLSTVAVPRREIAANGVALEAVYAPLALFEIYRIRRQVPMHHGVAVLMEVEPLLADRRRGQYERPERRVERLSHLTFTGQGLVLRYPASEPNRKVVAEAERLHLKATVADREVGGVVDARSHAQRLTHLASDCVNLSPAADFCVTPRLSLRMWAYSSRTAVSPPSTQWARTSFQYADSSPAVLMRLIISGWLRGCAVTRRSKSVIPDVELGNVFQATGDSAQRTQCTRAEASHRHLRQDLDEVVGSAAQGVGVDVRSALEVFGEPSAGVVLTPLGAVAELSRLACRQVEGHLVKEYRGSPVPRVVGRASGPLGRSASSRSTCERTSVAIVSRASGKGWLTTRAT